MKTKLTALLLGFFVLANTSSASAFWGNFFTGDAEMKNGELTKEEKAMEALYERVEKECYKKGVEPKPVCIKEKKPSDWPKDEKWEDTEMTLFGGKCEANILKEKVLYEGVCKSDKEEDFDMEPDFKSEPMTKEEKAEQALFEKIDKQCYKEGTEPKPVCVKMEKPSDWPKDEKWEDMEMTLFGGKCEANILKKKILHEGNCKSDKDMGGMGEEGDFDEIDEDFDEKFFVFPDMDANSLEAEAAAYLKERNIIGGRPNGNFDGEATVNRAEAAKFLLMAQNIKVDKSLKNNGKFKDVLEGEWYVKYVIKAADLGIITGYKDKTFKPGKTVNTAEFLKMMTKTFRLSQNLPHKYADVKSSDWFAPFAGSAEKYKLFPKRSTSKLEAGKELTRNELAVAIYQYLEAQDSDTEYEGDIKTKKK